MLGPQPSPDEDMHRQAGEGLLGPMVAEEPEHGQKTRFRIGNRSEGLVLALDCLTGKVSGPQMEGGTCSYITSALALQDRQWPLHLGTSEWPAIDGISHL